MKILKLVVTRSSTLQVVPQGTTFDRTTNFFQNLHGSYSDSEVFCKKELAGRTMEFSYDVSQTPLIGRRLLLKPDLEANVSTQARISQPFAANISGTPNSPRRSTSLSPADTGMTFIHYLIKQTAARVNVFTIKLIAFYSFNISNSAPERLETTLAITTKSSRGTCKSPHNLRPESRITQITFCK